MRDDPLLTVPEVASMLRVNPETVRRMLRNGRLRVNPETIRRWLRQGKLEGAMLGGDRAGYRIAESELRRLLEEGKEAA